jgi:hypothetical protein
MLVLVVMTVVMMTMTNNGDDGGDDMSLLHSTPFTLFSYKPALRWAD